MTFLHKFLKIRFIYRAVMYEAPTADIFNMTDRIFKFLGLEFHVEVQNFSSLIQSLMPVTLSAPFVTRKQQPLIGYTTGRIDFMLLVQYKTLV